jgi:hypothetical protein
MRRLCVLTILLVALMPAAVLAQQNSNSGGNNAPASDANGYSDDTPLGDVARNLRKKTPPSSQGVIDDDNLTQVMSQAESRHDAGAGLTFLMTGESKEFRVAAPDVTCSLAFTANVKTLLSNQYSQMALPPDDVLKLDASATIEGDALIVSVLNRTDWHVSEVTVALTVVKKSAGGAAGPDAVGDVAESIQSQVLQSQVRPERKPDSTVIYRMRAAASPTTTTAFSAPLNLKLAADEEWHWAIVQARGYPPQSYAGSLPPTTQASTPASVQPASAAPLASESAPIGSLPLAPQ